MSGVVRILMQQSHKAQTVAGFSHQAAGVCCSVTTLVAKANNPMQRTSPGSSVLLLGDDSCCQSKQAHAENVESFEDYPRCQPHFKNIEACFAVKDVLDKVHSVLHAGLSDTEGVHKGRQSFAVICNSGCS
eukprot:TRINITY_DN103442_c0_g1_i1.p1 TRINITY_DN103442_c0_g1~~TRINITY_DN103442_c0_g1_i1.p1  ORF type:complete len:131 (-),score=13.01 TRINITY_DN103442_c0_g1_i1:40-432(-)